MSDSKFPKTIGIVGYGDFGQFLHKLAKELFPESEVRVFSRRQTPDGVTFFALEEVCQTEVLILSVAISAFSSVIDDIKKLIGTNTVVVDVATVKSHTVSVLKEAGIKNFIATHPMFGPYSYEKHNNSLKDLRITVCDHTLDDETYQKVLIWFKSLRLKVLEMSAEEHDKLVAETLFLTHLVGQIVKRGGFERTAIDTVSFGFLMDAVESVAHDEALFRDVYKFNPYCKEVLERFKGDSSHIEDLLK